MKRIAVILYGPPGSGKSTQAAMLADRFGLIHFDTGKFLEAEVYDPVRQKEPAIRRERKHFEEGDLMTSNFVYREVSRAVRKLARAGWGIVLSGSPRTLYEAKRLAPLLEKLYGKKHIFIMILELPKRLSITRNSSRLVCTVCKRPLLAAYYPLRRARHCPYCGGRLYRRTLDVPDVIRVRLREYKEWTTPVFAYLRSRGHSLHRVGGRAAPYKVLHAIARRLPRA
jgi:adenylate kinase